MELSNRCLPPLLGGVRGVPVDLKAQVSGGVGVGGCYHCGYHLAFWHVLFHARAATRLAKNVRLIWPIGDEVRVINLFSYIGMPTLEF